MQQNRFDVVGVGNAIVDVISNVDDDLFSAPAVTLEVPFDAVITAASVRCYKPGAAIFHAALAALGVEAGRALFVGDRLHEDVGGAGAVGMTTVQALWFHADDVPGGPEPAHRAFTAMDVLNLVRRLNGDR